MANVYGKLIADFEVSLAAAVAVSAESATLSYGYDDDGVILPTGYYYLTLDRDNSSKEYIYCKITGGTAVTEVRNISRQGASTTGFARAHRIGSKVSITDFATIKAMNDVLTGAVGWDSASPVEYDAEPTLTDRKQLATKGYMDDVAIAGSPAATDSTPGIAKLSVAAASVIDPIVVGDNDNRVPPVDTSTITADIVAALDGTGTPNGTTGKFVTNDDTGTSGANKVLRLDASGDLPALSAANLTDIPLTTISVLSASDTLVTSADTERTHTGDTDFYKIKTIRVNKGGAIRTKFDIKNSDGGTHSYGKLYVNGIAGTQQEMLGTSYATKSEDIYIPAFSVIDLYIKTENGAHTVSTRNFRVYYTVGTTANSSEVITD